MKKLNKKVLGILTAIAVMLSLVPIINTMDLEAATGVGYVTGTTVEVTERGASAKVTYTFAIDADNAPITSCYAILKWDSSLMTFDKATSTTDNMTFANEVDGQIEAYVTANRDEKCSVTLSFKNAFPIGTTATSAPIDITFQQASANEFSGMDWAYLRDDQIQWTYGGLELNLPVSVSMNAGNPTSIMKGQSGTFAATVTNDDGSGVKWSLSGATDSSIDPDTGELIIGDNETATSLKVTATSLKDNKKSVTATVAVTKKPGLSLSINPTSKKLFKNEAHTVNFTAKAVTTEAGTVIKYSLAGAKHTGTTIDVNTGELTIDKDETAYELIVTATAENNATEEKKVTATAKVSLVEISVVVNPSSATVEKGETQDFKATVTNDLTNEGVTWKLEGNKSDKTILVDGKLTVAEDETATDLKVTATSVKDSSKSATVDLKVVEAPEITITIDPINAEVKQGSTQDFTAVVGNDKKNSGVEWSITGATSKDTKIETNTKARVLSDTARLSVGEDEKVGTVITVEAKSVTDGTKVATATVVVTAKDEVTTPTNPSNPSVAPGGTTQGTTTGSSNASTVSTVKTGDNTNMGLLMMMLGVSVLGIFSVVRRKKAE